ERGRKSWTLRALDEYRSLIAFTSLVEQISRLRLSFDVLGTAVRVVRDEHRHVELCRRMVVALGGDSLLDGEPAWVECAGFSTRRRMLEQVVGGLCVGETVSVHFLAAMRDETADPFARAVLSTMVADES